MLKVITTYVLKCDNDDCGMEVEVENKNILDNLLSVGVDNNGELTTFYRHYDCVLCENCYKSLKITKWNKAATNPNSIINNKIKEDGIDAFLIIKTIKSMQRAYEIPTYGNVKDSYIKDTGKSIDEFVTAFNSAIEDGYIKDYYNWDKGDYIGIPKLGQELYKRMK